MADKIIVWLVWEFQIVDVGNDKVQLHHLRVIASSRENAVLYKKIFTRSRNNRSSCATKDTWFEIEERELDHALGFKDLKGFVSKRRENVLTPTVDYETKNIIVESKVSVPVQQLQQLELYLISFPEAKEAKLIDEEGSVLAWMRKK